MPDTTQIMARLRMKLDDYDREADDAAEQGEVWPHDPGTEVDVAVGDLRALLDEVTRLQARELELESIINTFIADLGEARGELEAAEAELARLRAPAGDVGEVVKRLLSYRPTYGWPEETATTVEPTLNVVAADLLLRQAGEIEAKDKHIELLQSKIDAEKSCACSFDRPGDVCAVHSPLLREAGDRINQLIDALGSTSMGQKDGARRSALKFLAKL